MGKEQGEVFPLMPTTRYERLARWGPLRLTFDIVAVGLQEIGDP